VADAQKFNFKFDKENKGKFIQKGLWKYSRHPNYCGEVLVWLGISIFVLRSLQNWQYFTMISPVFVYLLLSKVSGVPLLEAKA
jgi:steroid 5-alpha reductase family enzyme